ncbi:MAG: DUF58 domain-containing protein [Victivallales bacterium]|nr:DUF58 domain-containing protein [Victivallales bacterium]
MNPFFQQHVSKAILRAESLKLSSSAKTTGLDGRRLGTRTGNALEFAEYRDYHPGDDIRRLDWRVFARSERFMVKMFSEEIDPRCDIIIDQSASMGIHDEKAAAALSVAALLAIAAQNAGFSLSVWHAADVWEKEPTPFAPLDWRNTDFNATISPVSTIAAVPATFHKRGLRIVISDLLWPEEPARFLRPLTDGALRTFAIQLLHEDDLSPSQDFFTTLQDAESAEERNLLLDDATVAAYKQRLATHLSLWERACNDFAVTLIRLNPAELLRSWDISPLSALISS